jgi:hypothetical protein
MIAHLEVAATIKGREMISFIKIADLHGLIVQYIKAQENSLPYLICANLSYFWGC